MKNWKGNGRGRTANKGKGSPQRNRTNKHGKRKKRRKESRTMKTAAADPRQELAQKVEELQLQLTDDNGKIAALADLLRIAEPQEHEGTRSLAEYQEVIYRISLVITDYTDRIGTALSELEFITR